MLFIKNGKEKPNLEVMTIDFNQPIPKITCKAGLSSLFNKICLSRNKNINYKINSTKPHFQKIENKKKIFKVELEIYCSDPINFKFKT